jgi:hypothetical protein
VSRRREHRLEEALEPLGGGGLEVVGRQDEHRGDGVLLQRLDHLEGLRQVALHDGGDDLDGGVALEERLQNPQLLAQGHRRPLAVGTERNNTLYPHLREPGDVCEVGIHINR